jgi:glycosyltransferase involved in cell wall biosynthesis
MKKVLHIFSEINYSGAELMWYASIEILKKQGYEIELVATGRTKGNFAYAFEEKDIKIHHLPIDSKVSFLLNIFKIINFTRPHVLHIHPENQHFYFYYALFGKFVGSKVIRTIHNIFKSRIPLYVRFIRKLSKIIGCKFVSISKSVQDNELNFFKNHTSLINNWADDYKFKAISKEERKSLRKKLNLPENKILLVSVGNCAEVKNHKLIIDTLVLLDDNYLYLHIGKEDEERSELKLVQKLGVEHKIYFLGTKSNVNEYLQAGDIFIMPSLHEGVGNSAIEALMSGIKTILTDVHGLNAFKKYMPLVEYVDNNKKMLANTIINSNDIKSEKLDDIRKSVVSQYGVKQGVEKYLELYE